MSLTINSQELANAIKAMHVLPDKVKGDTMVKIFRTVARPMINRARAAAPKDTGTLARSIGTRKGKSKVRPTLIVGPMARRGGYHGHLLEAGTEKRYKKSGASTGKIKGYEYMKAAYDGEKDMAAAKIQKRVIKRIDSALKKHGFKGI